MSGVNYNSTARKAVADVSDGWQTFTPTVTLVGGAGNTVPVYTTNSGRYINYGKVVHVAVLLTGDGGAEGAGTGVFNVALPATAGSSVAGDRTGVVGFYTNGTTFGVLIGIITASATTISLERFSAATTKVSLTGANQNNTTRKINLRFFYEIN